MASESSAADQSIDENAEEKKVGDVSKCADGENIIFQPKDAAGKEEAYNNKEEVLTGMASTAGVSEEKHEPDDVSVFDVTKKEEQNETIREVENSIQESEVSNSSEPAVEINEKNLQSQADDAHETPSEVQENSSDFVETSASQESVISESKTEESKDNGIIPTFENDRKPDGAPLVSTAVDISEDGNVEAEIQEAANSEFSKDKVNIELINSEDPKDEIQVLVPTEIPTAVVPDTFEVPEKKDNDSGNPTSVEVHVKDLEVESGFLEEHKSKETTETKERNSNVSTIDAVGEVVGSSSYEGKPSEVAAVVEKKADGLEVEIIQTSVKNQDDIEAKPELAQAQFDENVSEGVEVKKDDEIFEGGIETSAVPDGALSLAEVSSEEEKASEPGMVVEEKEGETNLKGENIDISPKVAEVTLEGGNVLEGDKLVDKENVVNAEVTERNLVDTFTDPTEAEVSSDEVRASTTTEIVKEALEVTSMELNIAPEASEVSSDGDKLSAGDGKSESLKGEAATSVEAPKDITTSEESLDQVIEEKSASSISETQALSEDNLVNNEKYVNEEAKEINLQSQADGADETPSAVQSDFTDTSISLEPVFLESKNEDLKDTVISPTSDNVKKSAEAPLVSTDVDISEDGNVLAETQEAAKPESSKDKVDIELVKSEDSEDEIQLLVPDKVSTVVVPDASETPEKNDVDSSNLTSIEVPVNDLEVESGSPEEQKSKEGTETKESSSNMSTIDAGGEVTGSLSYEIKPSGVAEVVEKKDDSLEVGTIETSVKIQDDIEAKPELAQAQLDENVSEGVEVKKDDEIFEGGIATSAVPDGILSLAEVSSEEEKTSEPGIVVEEEGETYLKGENIDISPKVTEVTLEGENVLEGDKLVDKEKVVNAEAIETHLVDTFTDPTEAEVCSDEVKVPTTTEIVKEALEVTSKELNITPEASEVSSDGDKRSAGDGKSESLKGEAATSVEAPKDITTAEESLDQVIEEKSQSSISETQTLSEDNLVNNQKYVNEEAKEINLQSQADGADETSSAVQSDFTETSISQEPVFLEFKNEDVKDTVIKPTSENVKKSAEAPLVSTDVDISEDGNVLAETQEAANPESSKDKVDIELIKSEDSKDEIQLLVPDKIFAVFVPDASETPEQNDVDSSNFTSIEVPVKDLEVESGSPEEKKSKEGTETKEASSNMSTIDAGGEIAGSLSYEIKPSGVAEVIEKKDDGLEVETIETSVKIQEDLEAKPELAQTESDENVSRGVEVKKDDEIVQGGIETSTVPNDVLPFAKVSSEEEKASEPGVVVEEEETFLESDDIDTVPKVAQVSLEDGNVFEGDRLVDKEKVVNTEAVERDFVDTFTDPTKAEVSYDQVKAPATTEIVNEALEVTSKELNIASEASEGPDEVDKVSVDDEVKSEILKGGDATSLEVPKYNIAGKESLDQSVEEKSVSLESEMAAPDEDKFVDKEKYVNIEDEERDLVNTSADPTLAEVSSEQLKVPEIVKETDKHSLEEVSKELNIAPEASEVPAESDKLSAGEEKSESLEGEAATLVDALKDITTAQESLDQGIEEKKNESSTRETQAPSEDKLVEKEKYVYEEAKEIYLQSQADDAHETPSVVQSDFVETSAFQELLFSESKTEDLKDIEIKPTSENEGKQGEAPLVSTSVDISEDRNVEAVTQEAKSPEFSKDKITMELISSEDSKDEIQVFAPTESPTVVFPNASEAPEKNDVDSSYLTSIEVPAKDPEVKSGYPEELKPIESTETNEASSNVSAPDTGGEVVGSSYEANPSGNAEVVEKRDDGLEVETSVEIEEDLKAKPVLAQTQSDESVSVGAEVKKNNEIIEGGIETSIVPDDVPPLSTASSEEEKTSEPGVVVEEDETSLKGDNIGIVAEVSSEGRDVLEGNKLVEKEKDVNAEAVERELVGTFIDPADAKISSDQVKTYATTEIVKEESDREALEMTSKELNIVPEASEDPYEVDTISAGDEEKSERLIVRDGTSVEAPQDIIAVLSLDHLVEEKKSENSISEMADLTEDKLVDKEKNVNVEDEERDLINTSTDATAAEVSSEQVKAPEIVEESNKPGLEETSKELNIAPEASEVPSEDDKLSAGEEKDESLKGEAATSVEVPKDITIVEELLDQVIEEKTSENSVNEMKALAEDKLVDKEKNVNEEAKEGDLVDTSTDPAPAKVSSDQVKASETAEIIKEQRNKQALEVPSEGDEISAGDEEKREILKGEDATLVEAPKDITIAEESPDQVIKQKKSEGSKSEIEALTEDKLVDKEKDVNAGAEKTYLVDIPTDPSAAEVFSEQVKVSETAEIANDSDKETLELTSKELNIVPVAVEVPSEGDKVSSGEEEMSVSLKGEDATSLEPPKEITAVEKSVDQLIEENKGESLKNETQAPIETTRDFDTSKLFPEAVKEIIASEAVEEKQNETSNDLRVEEKKANDSEDKKEEVKTEGVLQNATDKPEQEELGAEKAENEKSKDQDPNVSSDSRDVKLTKEVTKRESNIFSKVKRSIVKAKKAILRKSPGPKTLSSEAKDENA